MASVEEEEQAQKCRLDSALAVFWKCLGRALEPAEMALLEEEEEPGQKCPTWQCLTRLLHFLGTRPGGSGRLETPKREARPLGAQPAPALLEPAATKAADSTAFLTLTLTLTLGGGAGGTDVD